MTDEDYIRKKFRDMDASTDQSLKGLMWDSAQVRKVIREREREREREHYNIGILVFFLFRWLQVARASMMTPSPYREWKNVRLMNSISSQEWFHFS